MTLRCHITTIVMLITSAVTITDCDATPVRQVLVKRSSSVAFGVKSPNPTLSMNGSFRDFSGTVLLDPSSVTNSHISLSLSLSSARLPAEQILQAVFLQTVIAKLPEHHTTFTSTALEHLQGSRYMVHGTYSWFNKQRKASVPIEIQKASPSLTEIRLLLDGSLHDGRNTSLLAQGMDGSRGWTKAVLVFSPTAG
jgi:polyisoprenoid-binding protein YceI